MKEFLRLIFQLLLGVFLAAIISAVAVVIMIGIISLLTISAMAGVALAQWVMCSLVTTAYVCHG